MPSVVQFHRQALGTSVEGRPIEGIFFGDTDLRKRTQAKLNTLFVGVFHGDEGISGELLERFAWSLQQSKTELDWGEHPILIVPVLNPDGLQVNTRMNAHGVDLNRNYPTQNWHEENLGTPYYSGPAAASEPETQLVIHLIETYQPQKIVTVHSPYKVINFDGPAKDLAGAMAECSGYPVVEDIGYPTPGSFGTYAGKERSIPVITLELPPGPEEAFNPEHPPVEDLDSIWRDNRAALVEAIRF